MAYYKKYSGGGFYDKKSGQWISSTRAHQRVNESIGGWTKRRARDGSYYMERDDDWDDDWDDEPKRSPAKASTTSAAGRG